MGVDEWVRDIDTDIANIIRELNRGPRFAKLTTAQRDSLTNVYEGQVIYNITTKKLNVYTSTWEEVQSS